MSQEEYRVGVFQSVVENCDGCIKIRYPDIMLCDVYI
jgi:hypothetical protein